MNWKDYFYFEKRDRYAIILLLILITICGILYILTRKDSTLYPPEESAYQKQLDEFQSNLKEKQQTDSTEYIYPILHQYTSKLKPGETIELNSADTTDLKKIPGIGTSYANRIVKYRNSLGGYVAVSQLRQVWGLDTDLYQKITPYITIKRKTKKIKINQCSAEELRKHPYINYKQAKVITDLRMRKGNITSINRLSLLDEFSDSDIKRLEAYISFE